MPNNLESGFRATRIHPYNPGAIPDEAYSNRHPMPKVDKSAQDDSNGYDDANTLATVAVTDQSLAANIVSSTHDATLESNAVSSITLSMPITTDGLCNLPLSLDPNDSLIYNLNYADDTSLNDLADMLINCNSEEGQNEKTIVYRMHRRHNA